MIGIEFAKHKKEKAITGLKQNPNSVVGETRGWQTLPLVVGKWGRSLHNILLAKWIKCQLPTTALNVKIANN